jgi:hypothetical protein
MWRRAANRPDNRALYPLLEIAKHYERVARDFAAARAACERALALIEAYHMRMGYARAHADRAELLKRIERLDTRMRRDEERAARRPSRKRAPNAAV